MHKAPVHETHPLILKRLKRAEGQVRSITAMIESGRPCLEIAQQLQAVESAIRAAKKTLIHDHIDHCLGPGGRRTRRARVNRRVQDRDEVLCNE